MSAFELLHPAIKQALYDLRWDELRPLQVDAIQAFSDSDADLVLSAATASGKTEAAFLPLLSQLVGAPAGSVGAIYIGPLKALINDQFGRLEELCRHAEIPVHRWHGDVSATAKKEFRKNPGGVLLITPESLESNFINYGNQISRIYAQLKYVVIDELHSFMCDVRGTHLRSLLSRLEQHIEKRPRRLGLSATLADFNEASLFLNSADPTTVRVLCDEDDGKFFKVGLRAYPSKPRHKTTNLIEDAREAASLISEVAGRLETQTPNPHENEEPVGIGEVTEHRLLAAELARVFIKNANLIFTNSRSLAEMLADRIHELEKAEKWSRNPFVLHHGSLSKEVREDVESRLKKKEPITAFCTSTLEMGIDIGSVQTVGQLGPPWSVSSLVQRVGRSGRKQGESKILRMYSLDPQPTLSSPLDELLCPQLLRCIALIELMIAKWLEPADTGKVGYSTLIHQILSVLKETGGSKAVRVHEVLCVKGAFSHVEAATFTKILRSLGHSGLIQQMADGTVILTPDGEALVGSRDFYAAFSGGQDFAVRYAQDTIGRIPRESVPPVGEHLLLNGKRWKVTDVESRRCLVEVVPAKGFKQPVFLGSGGEIHSRVFQEMRAALANEKSYPYLHDDAAQLLKAARKIFQATGLNHGSILKTGVGADFYPWVGTRTMQTFELCARADGLRVNRRSLSLRYEADEEALHSHFTKIAGSQYDLGKLAQQISDKHREKYDEFLPDDLLDRSNINRCMQMDEAAEVARRVLRVVS
jgi:ATP-dependent helicase Lhr and Lhr-like helicase